MATKPINGNVTDIFAKKKQAKQDNVLKRIDITLQERLTLIYTTSEFHAVSAVMAKFYNWPCDVDVKDKLYSHWLVCQDEVAREINLLCDYAVLPHNVSILPYNYRTQEHGQFYAKLYSDMFRISDKGMLDSIVPDAWGYIQVNDQYAIGRDTLAWFKHLYRVRGMYSSNRDGWPINSPAFQVVQQYPALAQLFNECVDVVKASVSDEAGAEISAMAIPLYCSLMQSYTSLTVTEFMQLRQKDDLDSAVYITLHGLRNAHEMNEDALVASHERLQKAVLVLLAPMALMATEREKAVTA